MTFTQYSFDDSRASAYCACSKCGWGVVWTFLLSSILSLFLSLSLWETARYRLKYCLKGPLNPKQPTNLPNTTQESCILTTSFSSITMPGQRSHRIKDSIRIYCWEVLGSKSQVKSDILCVGSVFDMQKQFLANT